jgi:hypothetical protein
MDVRKCMYGVAKNFSRQRGGGGKRNKIGKQIIEGDEIGVVL